MRNTLQLPVEYERMLQSAFIHAMAELRVCFESLISVGEWSGAELSAPQFPLFMSYFGCVAIMGPLECSSRYPSLDALNNNNYSISMNLASVTSTENVSEVAVIQWTGALAAPDRKSERVAFREPSDSCCR